MFVEMTNKNAESKRLTRNHKGVLQTVDRPEMQALFGLTIVTGIVRIPRLTDISGFSSVMSRDRFGQIMRYLHMNDEALDNPDNDNLCTFVEYINMNFVDKFSMGYQISMDERLISFKGRLSFRQFIPSKRARFGTKCSVLTDAANSFVSRFSVKTGRDASAGKDVPLSQLVVIVNVYFQITCLLIIINIH